MLIVFYSLNYWWGGPVSSGQIHLQEHLTTDRVTAAVATENGDDFLQRCMQHKHYRFHHKILSAGNKTKKWKMQLTEGKVFNLNVAELNWQVKPSWVTRVLHSTRHITGHFRDEVQNNLSCRYLQCPRWSRFWNARHRWKRWKSRGTINRFYWQRWWNITVRWQLFFWICTHKW